MGVCLFCGIASGNVRAEKVYEDDLVVAFLDIRPIRPGHLQIIPRQHFDYFDDLPLPTAARILHIGQHMARALKRLQQVPRVALVFTGGDIPHAHAHVVPMHEATDITSRRYIAESELTFRDVDEASTAELSDIADRLRGLINEAGS